MKYYILYISDRNHGVLLSREEGTVTVLKTCQLKFKQKHQAEVGGKVTI